jgi:hypothetical protein
VSALNDPATTTKINGGVLTGTAAINITGNAATATLANSVADGTVTTAKIVDGAVTNAKLANPSLTVNAGTGLDPRKKRRLGALTAMPRCPMTIEHRHSLTRNYLSRFAIFLQPIWRSVIRAQYKSSARAVQWWSVASPMQRRGIDPI